MMNKTLKRLTDEDLVNICGGQIYKVRKGNKKPIYFLPTPEGYKEYNDFKSAVKSAPDYVFINLVECSSCEEAIEKAEKDAEIYSVISVFPFV